MIINRARKQRERKLRLFDSWQGGWRLGPLHVSRRARAQRFSWEWHNHGGVRYISVDVADPDVHRWWATSVTLYLTGARWRRWA
jgi:hypothetical protein